MSRVMKMVLAICSLALAAALYMFEAEADAPPSSAPPPASRAGKPIAGEAYAWRPVAIGGGGFITGMAADTKGISRVVRTDVHGAYIWNAKADRWDQLVTAASMPEADRVQDGMNEGAYEVMVAPGDPKRLYLAIKGRVYRSDDGGRNWVLPASAGPFPLAFTPNGEFRLYGPFLAVSPTDPNLVLLGTPGDGLWRSSDGGAGWTRIASVPASGDLRPKPGVQAPGISLWFEGGRSARVFAASAGHGLFVSRDGGQSFAPVGANGPATIAQAGIAPDGAVYAVDQEAKKAWAFRAGKWSDLTTAANLPGERFTGIAADPANGNIFVVDQGGQAWCSADKGARWARLSRRSEVERGDPPWLRVSDRSYFASGRIGFDPAVKSLLWVDAGTGPYVADVSGGCTGLVWKSQARGIEELVANDVVQPAGRAPLFAGWDFGIHVKSDLNAFSTTYGPKERVLIAAQQLDWSPSNPDFVVTNASDTLMSCCWQDGDSVLAGYSLDGGRHWSKFASLPQPPGTRADDPWRMSFGMIAVSADSIDNIVWAPGFNRSPFYTRDRGRSWQRVVLPGEVLPLTGSFEGYYPQRKILAADKVSKGTFYLAHSGGATNPGLAGLWRTSDGGATWTRMFKGEIAPNSRSAAKLRAGPGKAGHLFFTSGVSYGADTRLRRSLDGGATWRALDDVTRVDDVAIGKAAAGAGYPTIFISGQVRGRYGVWRSIDDAATWQRVAGFPMGRLDQVTVMEADKAVFGRVYLGYMGSGWLYGEPAPCIPGLLAVGGDRACVAVDRGDR